MKAKHRKRRRQVIDAALTGGLAMFVGHQVAAQTAPMQPAAPTNGLDEIIVTATRRQSTVEEIPYNITALSGADLARTGTVDLAQLANQVPGFNFEDRGPRFAGSTVPIMPGHGGGANAGWNLYRQ
jgi:outer membrane cobalamin receptor